MMYLKVFKLFNELLQHVTSHNAKKRENYIFSAVIITGIEKQHIYKYCYM